MYGYHLCTVYLGSHTARQCWLVRNNRGWFDVDIQNSFGVPVLYRKVGLVAVVIYHLHFCTASAGVLCGCF